MLFLFFLGSWLPISASLKAIPTVQSLRISGYPLPGQSFEEMIRQGAQHPIIGRLACPALTRLNLLKRASEPVLLSQASVLKTGEWRLELKDGIGWWDESPVTQADLRTFLEQRLPQLVQERSLGIWKMPAFILRDEGKRTVIVEWREKPEFGLFILNTSPLFRERSGQLECAGEYRISEEGAAIVLSPRPQAKVQKTIYLWRTPSPAQKSDWEFRFSAAWRADDLAAIAEERGQCLHPIDLPVLSLITWNPQGPFTKSAELRQILTQAIPRGALLRAGTGLLGDLVSGPLLRAHPGYDKASLVRPFDLRLADEALDRLGYKRPSPEGLRLSGKGQTLELVVQSPPMATTLAKVLVDSYQRLGIKLSLVSPQTRSGPLDGALAGVLLPWPDSDFLPFLHSKAVAPLPFWPMAGGALDKLLESYAQSLTEQNPDFETLQMIHRLLYGEELFSILVQHRSCLVAAPGVRARFPKVIIRNPDWFFELIQS